MWGAASGWVSFSWGLHWRPCIQHHMPCMPIPLAASTMQPHRSLILAASDSSTLRQGRHNASQQGMIAGQVKAATGVCNSMTAEAKGVCMPVHEPHLLGEDRDKWVL